MNRIEAEKPMKARIIRPASHTGYITSAINPPANNVSSGSI
jgi:hypothetical protein